jgi:hypothetical protein
MALKGLMIPVLKSTAPAAFSTLVRPPPPKGAEIKAPAGQISAQTPSAGPAKHEKPLSQHDDDLDPMARRAAQLAPPVQLGGPAATFEPSAIVDTHARVSLEEILPQLVKKIAWAGDGKKGSVRIELGAGELAGSTLLVHADDGKVRVELSVPPGVDANAWKERIHSKLSARGLDVESVDVR